MYKKTILFIQLLLSIFVLSACQRGISLSKNKFRVDACVSLSSLSLEKSRFPGVIWYKEGTYAYLEHKGEPGLHWIDGQGKRGTLFPNPIVMKSISPDGRSALFIGDDYAVYLLEGMTVRQISGPRKWPGNNLILTEDGKILGTDWDFHENRISVLVTDIHTGMTTRYDHYDGGMSSEPMAKVARNGLLAYLWANHFEAHLVVYDIWNDREVARYTNISYGVRPSWYGFLLNPEGTRILAISSLRGEEYDGRQQELFEVEIGKAPVQVTNFHAKHPYFLIYDLNFGGQRWSPDNRWVVITAIPSETREINAITAAQYLYLIDLENRVAYPFCDPLDGPERIAWSPDSRFFTLSIKDRLWVVEPTTRKSRLLLERPGIPLRVLGWTIP